MDAQDEIRPDTWSVTIEKYQENPDKVFSVRVDFKHLRLTSSDELIKILEKEPEINTFLLKKIPAVEHHSLSLSRNFFPKINLENALHSIVAALTARIGEEASNKFRQDLKTLCITSNELEVFPVLPLLPRLEEVYFSHNHIKTIDKNSTRDNESLCISSPCLRLIDIRNNLLENIEGLKILLDNHEAVEHLSLSSNLLTFENLSELPSFPNLKLLGLFANKIDIIENQSLTESLKTVVTLLDIKFPKLKDLYLLGNPLTSKLEYKVYRSEVLALLPRLRYLDGQPVSS